jgi:hypothetical protein
VALAAADAGSPVRVAVRRGVADVGDLAVLPSDVRADVLVDVESAAPLFQPDRWRERLRALGGDLSSSAGRLRLVLPALSPTPTSPAPSDTKACS